MNNQKYTKRQNRFFVALLVACMIFSNLSGYHVDVHATSAIVDNFIENGNTEDGGAISQDTWTDIAQSATEGTDFTTNGTTSASPSTYVVKTAKGLAWIADQVNNQGNAFLDCTVRLDTDIDLADGTLESYLENGTVSWTPIGSAFLPFMGTFDGNHKTISGIFITDISSGQGLFGSAVNATIKDVNVTNISIHTSSLVIGGIVGHAYNSTIENCSTSGSIHGFEAPMNPNSSVRALPSPVPVPSGIGGIVGLGTDVTISGCTNFTTITGISYVGGIIGNIPSTSINPTSIVSANMIKDCYTTGSVTADDNFGAVIGYCYEPDLTILNCYYNIDKTGTTPAIGNIPSADTNYPTGLTIATMTGLSPLNKMIFSKMSDWTFHDNVVDNVKSTYTCYYPTLKAMSVDLDDLPSDIKDIPVITANIDDWTYGTASSTPRATVSSSQGTDITDDYTKPTIAITYSYYSDETCQVRLDTMPTDAGTYHFIASVDETASQYKATSKPLSFEITKAEQAPLTFTNVDSVKIGDTLTLSATGGTTIQDITYTIDASDSTHATMNGDILTPMLEGQITVTATRAGSSNYKDVTASMTISIQPQEVAPPPVTTEPPTPDQNEEEDNSFNIEILIEGNGTITPNGDGTLIHPVNRWNDVTFTFIPDAGYEVGEVFVDFQSIGVAQSHTFKTVESYHCLKVVFVKSTVAPPTTTVVTPPAPEQEPEKEPQKEPEIETQVEIEVETETEIEPEKTEPSTDEDTEEATTDTTADPTNHDATLWLLLIAVIVILALLAAAFIIIQRHQNREVE